MPFDPEVRPVRAELAVAVRPCGVSPAHPTAKRDRVDRDCVHLRATAGGTAFQEMRLLRRRTITRALAATFLLRVARRGSGGTPGGHVP